MCTAKQNHTLLCMRIAISFRKIIIIIVYFFGYSCTPSFLFEHIYQEMQPNLAVARTAEKKRKPCQVLVMEVSVPALWKKHLGYSGSTGEVGEATSHKSSSV